MMASSTEASRLAPSQCHLTPVLQRCRGLGARVVCLWSFSCMLLGVPFSCATRDLEGNAGATTGSADAAIPLTLTLVQAPDLDVVIGETRDGNLGSYDHLLEALGCTRLEIWTSIACQLDSMCASFAEGSLLPSTKVSDSFKSLTKSEEGTLFDLLIKEKPSWLLSDLKEFAVAQYILKRISYGQSLTPLPDFADGGLENELKTAELLRRGGKQENCEMQSCKVAPLHATACVEEDLSFLSGVDMEELFRLRLRQFAHVKDKLEAGDISVGYFDALEWMACPYMSNSFMERYLEVATEFGAEPTEGGPLRVQELVKRWLEESAVRGGLEALIRKPGAVWILKASAAKALGGVARGKGKKVEKFGLMALCSRRCRLLFTEALSADRYEQPKFKRIADVLRQFLFYHQPLTRLTEGYLERLVAAIILQGSNICKMTGSGIECSTGSQLLTASVDAEDPKFAVPEPLWALADIPAESKVGMSPQSPFHRSDKESDAEAWALDHFAEKGSRLHRGLLALRTLQDFEIAVQLSSTGGSAAGVEAGSVSNPYLFCQTLWTRARELQAGSEAFAEKVEKWQDGGEKLGAILSSLLQSQPKWGLPNAYAPLTSACMQTAGFLHSIVEDYDDRDSIFKSVGRVVLRVGLALAKRLMGKRHRHAQRPKTWDALEVATYPGSKTTLQEYRGALQVVFSLANEFRKKFLAANVAAPVFFKPFIGVLLGMWSQGFHKEFSFANNRLSNAKKAFILAALLHKKGHIGFAVDILLEASEKFPKAKAMDLGRVSFVGNYGYQLGGAVVALAKRGEVKFTYLDLEEFFVELAAASDDPVDVIRVAIDLSNTLLALRETQKASSFACILSLSLPACCNQALRVEDYSRFGVLGFGGFVKLAATTDLAKESPDSYQDYLNVLFTTLYFARVSQVINKFGPRAARGRAQLQLSCPFMSSYIDSGKRQERQAAIAVQAIGAQGARSQIWQKITKSKLALVPFFTPIAAAVWLSEKMKNIFSRRRFARLGVETTPPLRPAIPINDKLLYLFAEASYFETTELRQVLNGEQLLSKTEKSSDPVINAGNVFMTYSTLQQLGYHGGISISSHVRPLATSTESIPA
ncbi:hypothetical protein Efla_002022 [Eimeria flavescens]